MGHFIIKKRDDCREHEYRQSYMKAIDLCREGRFEEAFTLCESSFDAEDDVEIWHDSRVRTQR